MDKQNYEATSRFPELFDGMEQFIEEQAIDIKRTSTLLAFALALPTTLFILYSEQTALEMPGGGRSGRRSTGSGAATRRSSSWVNCAISAPVSAALIHCPLPPAFPPWPPRPPAGQGQGRSGLTRRSLERRVLDQPRPASCNMSLVRAAGGNHHLPLNLREGVISCGSGALRKVARTSNSAVDRPCLSSTGRMSCNDRECAQCSIKSGTTFGDRGRNPIDDYPCASDSSAWSPGRQLLFCVILRERDKVKANLFSEFSVAER